MQPLHRAAGQITPPPQGLAQSTADGPATHTELSSRQLSRRRLRVARCCPRDTSADAEACEAAFARPFE